MLHPIILNVTYLMYSHVFFIWKKTTLILLLLQTFNTQYRKLAISMFSKIHHFDLFNLFLWRWLEICIYDAVFAPFRNINFSSPFFIDTCLFWSRYYFNFEILNFSQTDRFWPTSECKSIQSTLLSILSKNRLFPIRSFRLDIEWFLLD